MIEARRAEIARLCRRFQVRRLDVFGSAAREGDFDPDRSDVDFLVEFAADEPPLSLAQFFELRDELARVVGRPVDLVTAGSVRSPYISASIERSREPIYAA